VQRHHTCSRSRHCIKLLLPSHLSFDPCCIGDCEIVSALGHTLVREYFRWTPPVIESGNASLNESCIMHTSPLIAFLMGVAALEAKYFSFSTCRPHFIHLPPIRGVSVHKVMCRVGQSTISGGSLSRLPIDGVVLTMLSSISNHFTLYQYFLDTSYIIHTRTHIRVHLLKSIFGFHGYIYSCLIT